MAASIYKLSGFVFHHDNASANMACQRQDWLRANW